MNIKITDKNGITLKTKGKYVTEDIAVGIDESLLGGGGGSIEVPSVTDLVCDSDGNVSWNAPNIDSLAEYNPTISYIISVNDSELETSNTSINVSSYLVEGANTIYVKVKAVINHYGNVENVSIEYSKQELYVSLSNTTLSENLYSTSAVAINDKAYIFGGSISSSSRTRKIQCYDPISDTLMVSDTLIPSGGTNSSAVAINNKAYIFGGYYNSDYRKAIQCYDPISDTLTTMSASFNSSVENSSAVAINDKAYIFGGSDNTGTNKIYIVHNLG